MSKTISEKVEFFKAQLTQYDKDGGFIVYVEGYDNDDYDTELIVEAFKQALTSQQEELKKELIDLLLSKGEDNQNCYEGCYRDWVTKIESLKNHG